MDTADIQARLAQHRTIGAAPAAELSWVAAHGTLVRREKGESIRRRGETMAELWILLSGHTAIYVDRGLGRRKALEWFGGDVTGMLPSTRMAAVPGDAVVLEPAEALVIDGAHIPELIRECPTVTAALVHVMVDRARSFTSSDLQDEKMMSLGRISAGLAHELNNPASAAERSAHLLPQALADAEHASRMLGLAQLTETQFAAVERLRSDCGDAIASTMTPIERADREDALASWLDDHGIDSGLASSLVDTAVTTGNLDGLTSALDSRGVAAALHWVAACCAARALASDIERASKRMHDLVGAVKRSTYMDQHQAPETIDLVQGLRDSVMLLRHKAKDKSVEVVLDVHDIPPVRAIGSDLNQIWMNLIDNALDAVSNAGHVTVTAARDVAAVVVRIVDDGPGIPAEIRSRIFDQFFTTKPVGKGTGLGLDIARKLARRNDGDIEVESRPGHTEFRVLLPVAPDAASAG